MACQHCSQEFTLWHLLSCIWRSSCEHRWSSAVHSKNSSWCLLQLTLRLWFCVASQAVELHAAWPDYKDVFPQRETCAGTENCNDWTTLQEVSLCFYFLYLFQKQQTSGVWHPITPHIVSPLYLSLWSAVVSFDTGHSIKTWTWWSLWHPSNISSFCDSVILVCQRWVKKMALWPFSSNGECWRPESLSVSVLHPWSLQDFHLTKRELHLLYLLYLRGLTSGQPLCRCQPWQWKVSEKHVG